MEFTIRVESGRSFDDAIARVKEALKEQGFGVLTEIDLKQTLRDRIGVDVEPHVILGACNPKLAHAATQADPRVATLLPCNVVVRREQGRTVIEALEPSLMASLADRPELEPIATEASSRITRALQQVG